METSLIEKLQREGVVDKVETSRAVAETLGQMTLSKKFPRDMQKVERKLEAICKNPKFAESAYYTIERGNKDITGPSIRMAEAVVYAMGNINYGINSCPDQEEPNATRYTVFAIDLENNTRVERTFVRQHKRKAKGKIWEVKDPQGQYELIAADAAKRLRSCLFNIVPKYLLDIAEDACRMALIETKDEPLETKVEKMLRAFWQFDVSKLDIESRIGKTIDKVTEEDIVLIRGVYNAIKQGFLSKEAAFAKKLEKDPPHEEPTKPPAEAEGVI